MSAPSIPREAFVSLLAQAQAALADGDETRASLLLADLHWFAHGDAQLHQSVHRLQLAMARRRRDVAGMLGQILPLAFARPASIVESLGPSFDVVQAIAAPPDVVYAVIADIASYATWNPWLLRAEGSSQVGGKIRIDVKMGKRTMRIAHRMLTAVPGERFAWCDLGWFTVFASGRRLRWIEPTPEGSRLFHRIVLFGPFAHLAWRLHGDHIREGMTAETRALAERAVQLARAARAAG